MTEKKLIIVNNHYQVKVDLPDGRFMVVAVDAENGEMAEIKAKEIVGEMAIRSFIEMIVEQERFFRANKTDMLAYVVHLTLTYPKYANEGRKVADRIVVERYQAKKKTFNRVFGSPRNGGN